MIGKSSPLISSQVFDYDPPSQYLLFPPSSSSTSPFNSPLPPIAIDASSTGYVYHDGGSNTANQDLGIKVAHSVGTMFGQLGFGYLADHVGRKRMYGLELIIIIIGVSRLLLLFFVEKKERRWGFKGKQKELSLICSGLGNCVFLSDPRSNRRRTIKRHQPIRCSHHVAIHHGCRYRW